MPALPVDTPTIRDALWHGLYEFTVLMLEQGQGERITEIFAPVARAIGWVIAEAESAGAQHGVEAFFDKIVAATGEGEYILELHRRGGSSLGRLQ